MTIPTISISDISRSIGDDVHLLTGRATINASALPALTGSARQIEWAERIRAQALEAMGTYLGQQAESMARRLHLPSMPSSAHLAPVEAAMAQAGKMLAERVAERASASWWIDARDELRDPALAARALSRKIGA
ncbi:hypothetical protein [Roseomonas mucosa]|uniref:hypothetical protein n=1 Tax=Roseomonas mucosa TaxID=207340 RepID=UPI00224591FA|nr:hypothetical protein [Roseomonas mucosa]UZO91815.1 Hypothetical protein RMP42_05962 [Roseomonas mucosa]